MSISKYNNFSGISGIKSANSLNNVYGVQYAPSFAQFLNCSSYTFVTSIRTTSFFEFFCLTTLSKNSTCPSLITVYSGFILVSSAVNI